MSRGRRIEDGSFASVIRAFVMSPNFTKNAKSTRDGWARELAGVEEVLGSKSKHEIEPAMIQEFLDGIAEWPGKQLLTLGALKQLDRWAVVRKHLKFPCTYGCEAIGCDGGHIPWTDEQVSLGEKFAGGEFSRVITFAANTGQRLSDFTRMCWTDMEAVEGRMGINVRGGQVKTKRSQWVPITPELAEAMATWERRPGPILWTMASHSYDEILEATAPALAKRRKEFFSRLAAECGAAPLEGGDIELIEQSVSEALLHGAPGLSESIRAAIAKSALAKFIAAKRKVNAR